MQGGTISQKNKVITVIIVGIVLIGLAILIWAQKTGRVSIFGAENLNKIVVQIKNSADWSKGVFTNTLMENGILKLNLPLNPTPPDNQQPNDPTPSQPVIINNSAIQHINKTTPNGRCSALTPSDWAGVSDDYGMSAGFGSPDLTTFASWNVAWGLASLYESFGHPEYTQEDNFLKIALCVNNFSDRNGMGSVEDCSNGGDYQKINLGSDITNHTGSYKSRDYTLKNYAMNKDLKGKLIYKDFSTTDPSVGKILLYLLRMGSTTIPDWENKGATAISSAISIGCSVNSAGAAAGPSTSAIRRDANDSDITLSDKWQEAIMGYENVYDPNTKEHYQAPLNSYWETGPSGPGYYKQVGNDYIKLNRGFGWP